jgi:hypothetical protein
MELLVNNIKVPFGGSVSIRFYNPLFNDIGSHSFPINLSTKIPAVNKAFSFSNSLEAPKPINIEARIKSSIIDIVGSWYINEINGNNLEIYYKGSNGDFYSRIKNKLLTELSFGGIKYPAGVGANVGTVLAYMTTMMDVAYPDNDWTAFLAYLSNPVDGMSEEVNPVLHVNPTGVPYFYAPADLNSTVYLFAGAIIDYIFSEFGYRVEKSIFREDQDLKRLVIFNTYNRVADDAFDYTKLVPKILISDFLKALRNKFNIGFFVNEQSRSVKILSFDSIINAGPGPEKIYHSKIKIDKTRPSGLIFNVNSSDNWSGNAFNSLAELDPYDTLITVDKYNDIDVGMSGKKVYVLAESAFYDVDIYGVVTRIGPDLFPYIDGEDSDEIEQLSGTLGMYTINKNFETAVEYTVPYCDLTGNRDSYAYTDFPLIFLIAHGIQDCQVYPLPPSSYERQYPMASNDIYNAKGTAISGATLALRWHGTYGTIERFWTNRINWELNLKKLFTTSFKGEDLNKLLDFSKVYRIGENNCMINMIWVELSHKLTRIREAQFYRL